MEISDPSNPVMNAIKFGGDKELQEMYKSDIWEKIRDKHRFFHENRGQIDDVENQFLNSLNEQEYAEFVRNKPVGQSLDKYMKSGIASELLQSGI